MLYLSKKLKSNKKSNKKSLKVYKKKNNSLKKNKKYSKNIHGGDISNTINCKNILKELLKIKLVDIKKILTNPVEIEIFENIINKINSKSLNHKQKDEFLIKIYNIINPIHIDNRNNGAYYNTISNNGNNNNNNLLNKAINQMKNLGTPYQARSFNSFKPPKYNKLKQISGDSIGKVNGVVNGAHIRNILNSIKSLKLEPDTYSNYNNVVAKQPFGNFDNNNNNLYNI